MVAVAADLAELDKLLEIRITVIIKAAMVVQVQRHLYRAQASVMQVEAEELDIKILPPELVEVELAGVV
jgi:predicted kinase